MIPNYPDAGSQSDSIVLELPDSNRAVAKWESYSFNSDFLTPTDQWSFTTLGKNLPAGLVDSLYAGARVNLTINGKVQGGGYIDSVDSYYDRDRGTSYTITGRDVFARVVDSGADPLLYTFTPEQTLDVVLQTVFAQFGFSKPGSVVISNDANRSIMTGIRTVSAKGKALKATKIAKQLQPMPGEGLFQYVARFLHRFGLWCWPSADGTQVIVSTPAYDTPANNALFRRADGSTSNIVSGGVKEDATDQPSAILAFGRTYSASYANAGVQVIAVNELTGLVVDRSSTSTETFPSPNVLALIGRYPKATYLNPRSQFQGYLKNLSREDPVARPIFLHDEESRNVDELTRFVYRELSLRQQRMWTATYTVEGHTQGPNRNPWAVDTMVLVNDEEGRGYRGAMYVKGRTFTKSRAGGAMTKLDLILPYTIDFGGGLDTASAPTLIPEVTIVGNPEG